jgi:dTDP-L-rhamnose 4-epimerase
MVTTRVLVTGGAGFIGSTVVDRLVAEGVEVTAVDALLPAAHRRRPDYLNGDATYVLGDLRDPAVAGRAVAGVDAVSHQASMVGLGVDFGDVSSYVAHNDAATASLLEALHERRFAGRLVLASSMVVYGEGQYRCATHGIVRPTARRSADLDAGRFEPRCQRCGDELEPEAVPETAAPDPRNVYAATKLHQEHLCAAYAREHGASAVALRYHNVYGPRMPRDTPYAGVASILRSAVERGESPRVFEDGQQRRDFVHVADVARANLAALSAPAAVAGGPGGSISFNVCSGRPRTILDLARALSSAPRPTGPPPEVVGGYRLGDVRHVFASPDLAAEQLGFTAEVGFAEGVRDFARAPLRD